jgi:hypothetical protein
MDSDF